MSSLITEATIYIRRTTASEWTSNNPTPKQGEWCLETDTKYIKIGDGSTVWTSLAYQPTNADVDAKLTGVEKQLCKAWVNFDGTQSGTITPRDSYNVTDITKNSTGNYTINFTNAMNNANYSIATAMGRLTNSTSNNNRIIAIATVTTTSLTIVTNQAVSTTALDIEYLSVQIFGS